MKIYLPTYTNRKEVAEIETSESRFHVHKGCPDSDIDAIYKGTIYNATHAYKSESGAWAYWNRDFKTMNREEVDAMQFV